MKKHLMKLSVDADLAHKAISTTKADGMSVSQLVESTLTKYLESGTTKPERFKLELLKMPGDFHEGVDLSDRKTLYEIMEGRC